MVRGDAAVADCGRTEQRNRALPARAMVYFALGMALHSEGSYQDVMGLVTDGLAWADRSDAVGPVASKAGISHARDRLGSAPLALLFDRVAVPMVEADTPGCWLAGRRLLAVDGTCLDVPDTPANDGFFGRPGVAKGERSAFQQAWVVALAEVGSHAMIDAEIGPYTTSENAMAAELLARLTPGMLCLADRGFYSFHAWNTAAGTGADLLWRVKDNLRLETVAGLPDGSGLAQVYCSVHDRARRAPTTVRVIESTLDQGRASVPADHHHLGPPWTSWPPPTPDAGRSRPPSTKSKPTNAAPAPCCARRSPTGAAGNLGSPVLPLRPARPDVPRRPSRRPRPGPGVLRHRPADRPPIRHPAGRLSSLTTRSATPGRWPKAWRTLSPNSAPDSCPNADRGPTRASSNANTPDGTSNAPTITPGPTPTIRSPKCEQYWANCGSPPEGWHPNRKIHRKPASPTPKPPISRQLVWRARPQCLQLKVGRRCWRGSISRVRGPRGGGRLVGSAGLR